MRAHAIALLFAVALLPIGCAAAAPLADASSDAARIDAGRCDVEVLEASCGWYSYAQQCPVRCAGLLPAGCTFQVHVDWGPSYCCGADHGEWYGDCVCDAAGFAVCRVGFAGDAVAPPTTYCEFCGVGDDASVPDAALDGGHDDAGARESDGG